MIIEAGREPIASKENSGSLRNASLEEVHLIRKDVAVLKDHLLKHVRCVWNIQQLHIRLFRSPVSLLVVASLAGCDTVLPDVLTTARLWVNVVNGQLVRIELVAAVCAEVPVASVENLTVGVDSRSGEELVA
jgi:hypothetical protein